MYKRQKLALYKALCCYGKMESIDDDENVTENSNIISASNSACNFINSGAWAAPL